MKILFLLGASSRIRNFDHTIMALAERGHEVRVAGRLRKGSFELPPTLRHERISRRVNPTERTDEWRDLVDLLRGARDYVRYFDPRFAQATRLVRRAYEIAPTEFALFCERHAWVKRYWKPISRMLELCEDLIPTDPGFEAFLREEQPDLVLVTPLVTFESYQTDYVKAAHRLGLPVAFIPFSWDNLTNKGLMRVHPDRVLVWNNVQGREAIDLHGCRPDSVVVTGAARFDDFFARTPSTSRSEFFAGLGFDPARPMVVYLGSSQLTGPKEMELVRRWAESLRSADDERVRTCGILIRPHPAVRTSYASTDFSDLGQVAVSLNANAGADQELFDSIYHAHAAVGLNTSAMLEAAIVGRPVHTLVIPGFDEGQVGTIHFRYLVEAFGGLARIAADFGEHHCQLSVVLRREPIVSTRSRAFAERFLRPLGSDRLVSPILASEVERTAAGVTRRQPTTPVWHHPLRWALRTSLQARHAVRRSPKDSTVVGTSMSLRPVRTSLEEIRQSTAPVFVGPWVDSIGNELLYWLPFVRWVLATYGVLPERVIVISPGGASDLYGSLGRRHLDTATLFSPAEYDYWKRRTVPQSEQDPKVAVMSAFDAEIVERAARVFDLSHYQVLHPLLLFRVFLRLKKDRALGELGSVLRHPRPEPIFRGRVNPFPKSFVAFSAAFNESLPNTSENRRFLGEVLAQVAAKDEVVVVDDPPPSYLDLEGAGRVHLLETFAVDATRCLAQTAVMEHARAFVGGFGDLAVLASSCGTPATTYHSERLPVDWAERLQEASASAGWGAVRVERARRFKGARLPLKAPA